MVMKPENSEEVKATEKDSLISTIVALIKLTQTEQLSWTRVNPSDAGLNPLSVGVIDFAYLAKFQDLNFRLYEKTDESERPFINNSWSILLGKPKYVGQVILEVVDDEMRSLFVFPQVTALRDLLSSVKYQAFDVKNAFARLLDVAKTSHNEK
jgi:hypothetical protein